MLDSLKEFVFKSTFSILIKGRTEANKQSAKFTRHFIAMLCLKRTMRALTMFFRILIKSKIKIIDIERFMYTFLGKSKISSYFAFANEIMYTLFHFLNYKSNGLVNPRKQRKQRKKQKYWAFYPQKLYLIILILNLHKLVTILLNIFVVIWPNKN